MSIHGYGSGNAYAEAKAYAQRENEKWARENPTREKAYVQVNGASVQYERQKGLSEAQKKHEDTCARADYKEISGHYNK